MPEYLAPGVYVEEIERGPKPIQGVATSTAAFLGETERGPVRPKFITSYAEYLRVFGSVFADGKYMPHAVNAFFENGGRRCYIARIAGAGAATATLTNSGMTVRALGPGTAGNRIYVRIEPGTTKSAGASVGFRIRVFYWDSPDQAPIDAEADLTSPRPTMTEDFDDLSLDPAHPNYFEKIVGNGNSSLIELEEVADGTALPTGVAGGALTGGQDGAVPTTADYEGKDAEADKRTGLHALELDPYRDIAVMYAPNAPVAVVEALITHCEKDKYRFAVVDAPANIANAKAPQLDPRTSVKDTKYAAFYYPWLFTNDPKTGKRTKVPPGGAMCGIYARSDNTRGVWKAPANETVSGALDLEYDIDKGTQDDLNPKGVNVIRRFPGRGIRVWGARTMSSDPLWKYVSVRRLFIFIEASIDESTQWVVFEPNDQRLWGRVKQSLTMFLRSQWRQGALFGAKEEEAFFVNVGKETMTDDDILNGRLIVEIGIAPVRPAEFVIFRIFQKTRTGA